MIVVGLAGRAGSGKSAVARTLARRPGVAWIDLDELAWTTYAPGTQGFAEVARRFGRSVVAGNGTIDRAALGRIVFSDDAARDDLERIVYPALEARWKSVAEERRAAGTQVLLVEGAAIATSRHVGRGDFDLIVWLDAPPDERRARLRETGREEHADRGVEPTQPCDERGPRPEMVRIDARGTLDDVAARVWAAIERRSESDRR
ncbi:MAG: dephospho-CoA kinase [Candidatus Bipolaricaulota bacterium]|nr:dephospho-CoA kinase [Candidatus Bipolaricaulota bacterium]